VYDPISIFGEERTASFAINRHHHAMTEYRRFRIPGATWLFTVNLAERKGNWLLVNRIEVLRAAFAEVWAKRPFHIDAIVVLPDHLHCVWTLPVGESDFSTRWGLIKGYFSRNFEKGRADFKKPYQMGRKGFVATPLLGVFHSR